MRYVILGTAGHIDHGKSSLVKALTGIDPDRLKEEKERGITIDLGFADLSYPDDNLTIGIVDVPGHERLVRNMLAGAGGIDIVLMVIAADEGIMPQSREHLAICNLLRIKSGLVVLTKSDLVEPDWLELVKEEVREFVKGTFLDGSEVIPVSSRTGDNLDVLKDKIKSVALKVAPKPSKGLFRLPVDRVFTLKGFGTVVTGTALSGSVSVDEQVDILPSQVSTKVRGLHSHGQPVKTIHAGQRAAVNLQGIEKVELKRGDMVVTAGRFTQTTLIDAKVEMLKDATPLKNRSLVHFHLGTSETVARAILYGIDQLGPSESAYCQFRLQEPVVAQSGDRYIIRRFSPLETIGGGEVLDASPRRRKKKDGTDDLAMIETGTIEQKLSAKIRKAALAGTTAKELEAWLRAGTTDVEAAIGNLVKNGEILRFEDALIHREAFRGFKEELIGMLKAFHKDNPLKQGMPKEEVRARMGADPYTFSGILEMLDDVIVQRDLLMHKGFSAAVTGEDKARVLTALETKGIEPPSRQELAAELGMKDKQVGDILKLMCDEKSLVRLNDQYYITSAAYDKMITALKAHFAGHEAMTVAEFRDMLGTTRKYALPLLEFLDASRVTVRVGDVRKLLLKQ